jgi:hypothetical protein
VKRKISGGKSKHESQATDRKFANRHRAKREVKVKEWKGPTIEGEGKRERE